MEGLFKVATMIVILAIVATVLRSPRTVASINALARGFAQSIRAARAG